MAKFKYGDAVPDKEFENSWRVEAPDEETGEIRIAVFGGPDAEKCAVEYAMFKNGTHPLFKKIAATLPVVTPVPVPSVFPAATASSDRLELKTNNGFDLTIALSDVKIIYDARRKTLTMKPKPAIEINRGIISKESKKC